MNFLLDIGNVLINYRPMEYLEGLFPDNPLVPAVCDAIFNSKEWADMDRGVLSFSEATENICARQPEQQEMIRFAMQNVKDMFTPMQETIDLLPVIVESGHNLYYLSNMQFEVRDYLLEKHDFFNFFDGGVFSCNINVIKPSPEIYRHLLKEYNLMPEDCIFFDDVQANVKAAEKEGIKGVLFTTADCIRSYVISQT